MLSKTLLITRAAASPPLPFLWVQMGDKWPPPSLARKEVCFLHTGSVCLWHGKAILHKKGRRGKLLSLPRLQHFRAILLKGGRALEMQFSWTGWVEQAFLCAKAWIKKASHQYIMAIQPFAKAARAEQLHLKSRHPCLTEQVWYEQATENGLNKERGSRAEEREQRVGLV